MEIRFHIDENVHIGIAEGLRRRGVDVTTPADSGLVGASDEQHLAFAREQDRVVITHDTDFLRLHARGTEHAGIAFCHAGSRSLRETLRALSLPSIRQTAERMKNYVELL